MQLPAPWWIYILWWALPVILFLIWAHRKETLAKRRRIDWRIGLKCLDCDRIIDNSDLEAGTCTVCGSPLREPEG